MMLTNKNECTKCMIKLNVSSHDMNMRNEETLITFRSKMSLLKLIIN